MVAMAERAFCFRAIARRGDHGRSRRPSLPRRKSVIGNSRERILSRSRVHGQYHRSASSVPSVSIGTAYGDGTEAHLPKRDVERNLVAGIVGRINYDPIRGELSSSGSDPSVMTVRMIFRSRRRAGEAARSRKWRTHRLVELRAIFAFALPLVPVVDARAKQRSVVKRATLSRPLVLSLDRAMLAQLDRSHRPRASIRTLVFPARRSLPSLRLSPAANSLFNTFASPRVGFSHRVFLTRSGNARSSRPRGNVVVFFLSFLLRYT